MSWGRLDRSAAVAWHPHITSPLKWSSHNRDSIITPEGTDISTTDPGEESPTGYKSPINKSLSEMPTLALGTMGLDPKLEIATVDLGDFSGNFSIVGSSVAPAPFQCVDWNVSSNHFHSGIISGGMADGSVTLWDPIQVVKKYDDAKPGGLLEQVSVFRNQRVQALQFSPLKKFLLVAGSSNGAVSIIDTEQLDNIAVYEPGVETGEQENAECTCVAWNSSVAHILAAGSSSGRCVVWDLKQRKPVISISDQTHRHCRPSSILWLPQQPTQLLVVYDDDNNPGPQLWDLRNASYPLKEAVPKPPYGHTRGIVSASLNPIDPHLLLTTGRDNRIVCWWLADGDIHQQSNPNMNANDIFDIYLQQQTSQPHVQVHWSPSVPGMYAAASAMNVLIRTIHSASQSHGESVLYGPSYSMYMPQWFKRQRGISCGASNEVAAFSANSTFISTAMLPKDSKHLGDDFQVKTIHALDHYIEIGVFAEMAEEKKDRAENQEYMEWEAIFNRLISPVQSLKSMTGGTPELKAKIEAFLGTALPSILSAPNSHMGSQENIQVANFASSAVADPEKFFSELSAPKGDDACFESKQVTDNSLVHYTRMNSSVEGNIEWGEESACLVRQCILEGYIEGAVVLLIRLGLDGDALLLAGGFDQVAELSHRRSLWQYTATTYVEKIRDKFLKMVGYALLGDFDRIVQFSGENDWADNLKLLTNFVHNEEQLASLCSRLGERMLLEYHDNMSALNCMIMARDFEGACAIWHKQLVDQIENEKMRYKMHYGPMLLETMQKMVALKAATGFQGICTSFEAVAIAYAYYLSALDCPIPSMRVLTKYLLQHSNGMYYNAAHELANRLFHSHAQQMQQYGFAPPQGYKPVTNVKASNIPDSSTRSQWQQNTTNIPSASQTQGKSNFPPTPNLRAGVPSVPLGVNPMGVQAPGGMNVRPPTGVNPPSSMGMNAPPLMNMNTPSSMGVPPPRSMGVTPPQSSMGMHAPPPMGVNQPQSTMGMHAPSSMGVNQPQSTMGVHAPPSMGVNQPQSTMGMHAPPPMGVNQPQSTMGMHAPPSMGMNPPPPSSSPMGMNPPPPSSSTMGMNAQPPMGVRSAGGMNPMGTMPTSANMMGVNPPQAVSNPAMSRPQVTTPSYPSMQPQSPLMHQAQANMQPGSAFGNTPQYTPNNMNAAPPPITAPTVGAEPLKPGMPVPWPIPTSSQLNQRATRSTYAANVGINKAAEKSGEGFVLPTDQQALIKNTLTGLAGQFPPQVSSDILSKLEDLFTMLSTGELNSSACHKVVILCEHVQRQDLVSAQKMHADLSASEWGSRNKTWLMALKRLLSRP